MEMHPPAFEQVIIGSREEQACSPKITDYKWRGVSIAVPDRAVFAAGEAPVLPVCVSYLLEMNDAEQAGWPQIHITSLSTGASAHGPVVPPDADDTSPDAPLPPDLAAAPMSKEALEGMLSAGFFAANALAHAPLALRPGKYQIYVAYGPAISNKATVSVSLR